MTAPVISAKLAVVKDAAMTAKPASLPPMLVTPLVQAALTEDLGRAGDITGAATIPATAVATAVMASRASGVIDR